MNDTKPKRTLLPLPVGFDLDEDEEWPPPKPKKPATFAPEFEPTYENDEEGNAVIGLLAGKLNELPIKSR